MKKLLIGIWFLSAAASTYAACTTQTYFVNGKTVICTVCCDAAGNCNTFCT